MIESTTASDFLTAHDEAEPRLRSSTSPDHKSEWLEIPRAEEFVPEHCVVVRTGTTRNQTDTTDACDQPTYCKVIAEFKGYVDEVRDEWAYITLTDNESGERFFGKKSAHLLEAQGIELSTYFRCQIVEVLGERSVSIQPLAPKEITFEDFKSSFSNVDPFDG
jgi:hypothetical protein